MRRDVIWECRLSVELEYIGISGGDGIYLPCGSYHLGEDGAFRIVCGGAASRKAVGTARSAARRAARQAGRGEAIGDTKKNGTTAIKQSSRVIRGGASGGPTRDLRLAEPLLSQLSYCPVSVYI